MKPLRLIAGVGALIAAAAVSSCSDGSKPRPIPARRTVDRPSSPVQPSATSAERFGFSEAPTHAMPASPAAAPAEPVVSGPFAWDVPSGWQETPARPMRLVTFSVGDSGNTECYVSVFSNAAGGVEANVNRWLAQMRQEPVSGPALADLPSIDMLGTLGVVVFATGEYEGMDGSTRPDHALLGAICDAPEGSVFVKMIGPADEVEANRAAFEAFCISLRRTGEGSE